jgi:hypothetical protein
LSKEETAPDQVEIRRVPLWNNKKDQHGPFDIFGDLHGCAHELEQLLSRLGWERYAMEDPDSFWGKRPGVTPKAAAPFFWEISWIVVPEYSTQFGLPETWSRPALRSASQEIMT